jgi:hypothetical protein
MSTFITKSAAVLVTPCLVALKSSCGPRFHSSLAWVKGKAMFFAVAAIGAWFPEAADAKSTGELLTFYKDWAYAMLPWSGESR